MCITLAYQTQFIRHWKKKVRIIIFVYKHIISVNNILKAILLMLMLGR